LVACRITVPGSEANERDSSVNHFDVDHIDMYRETCSWQSRFGRIIYFETDLGTGRGADKKEHRRKDPNCCGAIA